MPFTTENGAAAWNTQCCYRTIKRDLKMLAQGLCQKDDQYYCNLWTM